MDEIAPHEVLDTPHVEILDHVVVEGEEGSELMPILLHLQRHQGNHLFENSVDDVRDVLANFFRLLRRVKLTEENVHYVGQDLLSQVPHLTRLACE